MNIIRITQAFFKWLRDKTISTSRIIAPSQLPPLYRFTLITLFIYIIFGIGSLAYKNIVLLETYRVSNETREIKNKSAFYSSSLDLVTNANFLDSYYREYFGLTGEGETLLLTTGQSVPKR